jgi:hypothetical protein
LLKFKKFKSNFFQIQKMFKSRNRSNLTNVQIRRSFKF